MKQMFTRLLLVLIVTTSAIKGAAAQEFWGTTTGGNDHAGRIFKADLNGGNIQVIKQFDLFKQSESGGNPGDLVFAGNRIFGIAGNGGMYGRGVLFELDVANDTIIVRHHFNVGEGVPSDLMLASNGKCYGSATVDYDNSKLFEFDPVTGNFRVVGSPTERHGPFKQEANGELIAVTMYTGSSIYRDNYLYHYSIEKDELTLYTRGPVSNTAIAAPGLITQGRDGNDYILGQGGSFFRKKPGNQFTDLAFYFHDLGLFFQAYVTEGDNSFFVLNDADIYYQYGSIHETMLRDSSSLRYVFNGEVQAPSGPLVRSSNGKFYGFANNISGKTGMYEFDAVANEVIPTATFPTGSQGIFLTFLPGKHPQQLSAAIPAQRQYSDGPITVTPLSSSGLAVEIKSLNPEIVSVSGNTLTPVHPGVATLQLVQAGNSQFEATTITTLMTITKGVQHVTITHEDVEFANQTISMNITTGSGLPIVLSLELAIADAEVIGHDVKIKSPGQLVVTATANGNEYYFNDQVYATFCANPPKPTVTVTRVDQNSFLLTSSSSVGNRWIETKTFEVLSLEQSITVSDFTSYAVDVTIGDCLSVLSNPVVIMGIENSEDGISVYPNPSTGIFRIRGLQNPTEVRFVNILGQRQDINVQRTGDEIVLDASTIPQGQYFLSAADQSGLHVVKCIRK